MIVEYRCWGGDRLQVLTVDDLRAALEGVPGDTLVVVASAQYPGSPGLLAGSAGVGAWTPKIRLRDYHPGLPLADVLHGPADEGEYEEDRALVIWPVRT